MGNTIQTKDNSYVDGKKWQLALFAFNDAATNCYMTMMNYVSYFATGVAGFSVVFISSFLMAMRIFDGITDPVIGFFMDKTNGKFGKFRPFIIIGQTLLCLSILLMYYVTPSISNGRLRLLFFIFVYCIYIVGYTCQTAVTKSGQTAITNDPAKRPVFGIFQTISSTFSMMFVSVFVSMVLVNKYGSLTEYGLFKDLIPICILIAVIFTIIGLIGIWNRDNSACYGVGETKGEVEKVRFKDYIDILKNNKGIRCLIVAASTDKLAMNISSNATVAVLVFGITIGDYSLAATMSMLCIPFLFVGVTLASNYAKKKGLRDTTFLFSALAILTYGARGILMMVSDCTQIGFNANLVSILFLALYLVGYGIYTGPSCMVIPMIADCTDYELYRSGKYVPGMIGTLFSFCDKLISSLATLIVGYSVLLIGYSELPDVNTPYAPVLKYLGIFLSIGLPVIGWICSLFAMKASPLSYEKMQEVREANTKARERAQAV